MMDKEGKSRSWAGRPRCENRECAAETGRLRQAVGSLEEQVGDLRLSLSALSDDFAQSVRKIVLACEYGDRTVESHIVRLSRYCAALADKIGLPKNEAQEIERSTPMHDVGKIGVPSEILMKPGKLTDDEFLIVKTHTVIGGSILSLSPSRTIDKAREIALSHHERWDGTGYPIGLKKKAIPIAGRIVSLMDTFDALTSKRPHKVPYPIDVACDMIQQEEGKQFDPRLVEALQDNLDVLIKIKADVDSVRKIPSHAFSLSERDSLN